MVGEYLIIRVKIAFTLHENRSRNGVKIVEGMNEPPAHGILQAQKRRRRNRNTAVLQGIKEINEHRLHLNRAI